MLVIMATLPCHGVILLEFITTFPYISYNGNYYLYYYKFSIRV